MFITYIFLFAILKLDYIKIHFVLESQHNLIIYSNIYFALSSKF